MCPSPTINVAAIVQDEEEIIHKLLTACEVLLPNLISVVIVDGGSTDNTIDVINSWRDRLPIDLVGHPFDNFAYQRNRALEKCEADFIVKGDADLTWSSNLRDRICALVDRKATFFDGLCYFSIVDAYHYVTAHVSAATVIWKNVGARYVRPIHEYLVWPGEESPIDKLSMDRNDWQSNRKDGRLEDIHVPFFDNSLRKSDKALRQRAARYSKWSALSGAAGIPLPVNDDDWCIRNRDEVLQSNKYKPLPPEVAKLIIPGT